MTAKTDLDNAFSILDAGLKAHVSALKAARAAANDDTFVTGLTTKVLAMADALAASNVADVVPASPAEQVAAPAAPVAPAPVAVPTPVIPLLDPGATPAMIAAAIAAQQAKTPASNAGMLADLEAAISKMVKK